MDVDKDSAHPTVIGRYMDIWMSVSLQVYKNRGLNTMERNAHGSSE